MTQSEQSNEIIYQRQDGYWVTRFTLEGRQFYGQTRHEVIEQILISLDYHLPNQFAEAPFSFPCIVSTTKLL